MWFAKSQRIGKMHVWSVCFLYLEKTPGDGNKKNYKGSIMVALKSKHFFNWVLGFHIHNAVLIKNAFKRLSP